MSETPVKLKSPGELAFVGDAVYELLVREHVALGNAARPDALHHAAIEYVRADAQAAALELIKPHLTEEEADIVRRGKNAHKVAAPRSASPRDYRAATALEALFGYLFLCGKKQRIRELFDEITAAHGEKADAGEESTK